MDKYIVLTDGAIGKGGQGQAQLIVRKSDIDKVKQGAEQMKNGKHDLVSANDFHIHEYVLKTIDYDQYAEKESQILQSLDHENIIKYIESFRNGNKLYIIMEYAEGGDLRHKICEQSQKGKAFPEFEVYTYFKEICEAIRYVHSKNILHRDLKPENVFLTDSSSLFISIKLGDFGIAKQLGSSNGYAKTFCGTNGYMAPEICYGGQYNKKVDIYSLGCILFELLTLKQYKYPDDPNNARLPCEYEFNDSVYQYMSNDKWRHLLKIMLSNDPKNRPSIEQVIDIVQTISYAEIPNKLTSNLSDCTIF